MKKKAIPKTLKTKVTADEIAEKASRGEDISAYFTNEFTVVRPAQDQQANDDRDITRSGPEPGAD